MILQAPVIGILIYLESETKIITAFINAAMASSKDSLTRICVFCFLMSMILILQTALIWSNIISLKELCCLQDEFTIMFGRIRSNNSSIKKAYLLSGVFFGLILIEAIIHQKPIDLSLCVEITTIT